MSILTWIINIGTYNYRRFELKTWNYLFLRRYNISKKYSNGLITINNRSVDSQLSGAVEQAKTKEIVEKLR